MKWCNNYNSRNDVNIIGINYKKKKARNRENKRDVCFGKIYVCVCCVMTLSCK